MNTSSETEDSFNTSTSRKQLENDHILTVLICAVTIPLSMSLWIINIVYSKIINGDGYDGKFDLILMGQVKDSISS